MIEKELRKPIEQNEKEMDIVKLATLNWFQTNSGFQNLDEREKAIVACQVVKQLQKEVLETYKRLKP